MTWREFVLLFFLLALTLCILSLAYEVTPAVHTSPTAPTYLHDTYAYPPAEVLTIDASGNYTYAYK